MDQRKSHKHDANGGLAEATATRLKFNSNEEVEMQVEEIPEVEVIDSDKTSVDYYFDS
jgi:type I protein arginine methyltransferase